MDFNRPDVYVQNISEGMSSTDQISSTVGILLGAARSGVIGEPVLISSWTEYIEKFANGLDTPFSSNSDLPYAVYGFFANGGHKLYVVRIASSSAAKAVGTGGTNGNSNLKIEAKYKGAFSPRVQLKKSADWVATTNEVFDVIITMSNSDGGSTTIREVTKDTIIDAINTNIVAQNWVVASATDTLGALKEETITLTNGADDISDLADSDYTTALEYCSTIEDATFIAIPGQTSETLNQNLLTYADNHLLFPILDMPVGSTVSATKTYRKSISAYGGILAYPWGYINDPLTNSKKLVPSAGHVMGTYARIIETQGIKKAPAGIDAVVKGFVSMEKTLTDSDIAQLNSVGVVCIIPKTNSGIVLWGARSLNADNSMKYVSDIIINYAIRKSLYRDTQFAIFEPNTDSLRSRVKAVCEAYLESLRQEGVLKGDTDQAYFVTCDESINTPESIANGFLYVDIGYATIKPTEFVVIRLAHSIASAE